MVDTGATRGWYDSTLKALGDDSKPKAYQDRLFPRLDQVFRTMEIASNLTFAPIPVKGGPEWRSIEELDSDVASFVTIKEAMEVVKKERNKSLPQV